MPSLDTLIANAALRKKGRIFKIKLDREEDGRWIADIENLPGGVVGCPVYGETRQKAIENVKACALGTLSHLSTKGIKIPSNIIFSVE